MTIATAITLARFALAGLFMRLLFCEGFMWKTAALLIFLVACATDALDGRIARRRNAVTFAGQLLDPIADKVLIFSALLSFVEMNLLPAWLVLLMLAREVFVTAFRFIGAGRGIPLPAAREGKIKTMIQIAGITALLIWLTLAETAWWNPAWDASAARRATELFYGVLAVTLVTGARFTALNWEKIGGVHR